MTSSSHRLLFALLATPLAWAACQTTGNVAEASLQVHSLRCDHLVNPIAIARAMPTLSWQVAGTGGGGQGAHWSATQVQVVTHPGQPIADQGPVWDSGWVEGDAQVSTRYAGKPLGSREHAIWRVRVRSDAGAVSPWSEYGRFSIGLLKTADWQGQWIGGDAAAGEKPARHDALWLRRSITPPSNGPVISAILHVASLGYHEVHINGAKVGDALLAPSVSDLSKRVQSSSYDVLGHLRIGSNTFGIWLGTGWSRYPRYGVEGGAAVRADLELTYVDGLKCRIATGPEWQCAASHVAGIGGWTFGNYGGERVDAGRARDDWSDGPCEGVDWQDARVVECALEIVPE